MPPPAGNALTLGRPNSDSQIERRANALPISAFRIDPSGQPALIGVAASTEPGPIDLTSPSGTRFLYADTGGGTVDEFHVNPDGTLTKLGLVSRLPVGIEGIASS